VGFLVVVSSEEHIESSSTNNGGNGQRRSSSQDFFKRPAASKLRNHLRIFKRMFAVVGTHSDVGTVGIAVQW
jgi:hypothetical protein